MNTQLRKSLVATLVVTPLFISHTALGTDQTTEYYRIYGSGNTPRLWLDETTADKSDWLLINDHTILESFSIRWDDDGSQQTPFRIETGSSDNLLYLDNNNRIGINKANPLETLEIATTQPGIRLDDISPDAGQVDLEVSVNRFTIQGNSEQAFINAETNAPLNSLYIDNSGHIGLGVANPGRDLVVGGSGDIHMENGDSDWLLYTSGSGFGIWNMDAIATVPLLVGTNAPTYSLVVEGDTGDLAVGLLNPVADLHVLGEGDGDEEELLRLESAVPPRMTMKNRTSDLSWSLAMTAGNVLNILYLERRRATFFKNGNMYLAGTLTQNSDRDSKTAIVPVDNRKILDTVVDLPISTWEYKSNEGVKHLGPMGQDFHVAFGLGDTPKGISSIDTGGVALAAIKGLNEIGHSRDKEIESLREESRQLKKANEELTARLTMLENLVNKLTAKEVVMNQ